MDLGRKQDGVGVVEQEIMRETGAKIRSVQVDVSLVFGKVNFIAARTENLDSGNTKVVAQPNWKHLLLVAECPGAVAEHIVE